MDNEAQKKYLIAADEQRQLVNHAHAAGIMGGFSVCGDSGGNCTDTLLHVDCAECIRRINFSFNARNKMGQFGESVLEHLWPYMRRGRRSPNPTIAVVVDHPGMTRDAYNALAVKWGIK